MRTKTKIRCFISILSVLALSGCASETAKKPESSASAKSSASTPTGKSSGLSSQSQAGSSLDAHREGKGPASGPLKEIRFDFDSYDLTPEARTILKANAAWLKANPSANVEIEGHCDERGTSEYNLALGAKRARAALDYLVSLGIPAARIKTTTYGEELPVCKESSENCYEKNRRDRFVDTRGRPAS
jgi:peptidoglycan-associated lipoprotein